MGALPKRRAGASNFDTGGEKSRHVPVRKVSAWVGTSRSFRPAACSRSYLQTPINIAVGVALDAAENVFVVNNTGGMAWDVVEFPAGATQGKVVVFRDVPKERWVGADTFDPKGALVASVNSAIDFFPHERGKPAQSLTKGVLAADGLAHGPDGTLFAANYEFETERRKRHRLPARCGCAGTDVCGTL